MSKPIADRLTRREVQLIADGREMEALAALIERGGRPDVSRKRVARQLLEMMEKQARKETIQ